MEKMKKNCKMNVVSVILLVLLCVYVIGLFLPVIVSIFVSFMNTETFVGFIDENATFAETMQNAFKGNPLKNYILSWDWIYVEVSSAKFDKFALYGNSLAYALLSSVAFTLCPTIVAYATARFKFRFSKVVYTFVIVAMSLPIVGSQASELRMMEMLGISQKMWSMGIMRFNFLSVYYLILFAVFESIPQDYSEAAKIDGASNFVVMVAIIIPQALNMIVTVFILAFISYWNDYQIPMLYLPNNPTIAQFLYEYSVNVSVRDDAYLGQIWLTDQMAATILMATPIIAVFIAFNKRLRISVAMGGVKG